MRNRLLIPLAAALIAAAAATPARADVTVAEDLSRESPIAARAGIVAWSQFDAATQRYRLTLQTATKRIDAPIPGSDKPFDVSLGTDRSGRNVALYTRCEGGRDSDCDVYRYTLETATERRVASVSGPSEDEAWPVQSGDLLAFVRRRARGGKGEISDCDVPFVKRLSSRAPSRRLDRGSCGRTTGMSISGARIVQVTFGSPPQTRFASQVRLLSARGGAARVLVQQTSGEESNEFSSPSQSASSVWLTRTGTHVRPHFVRLDIASRRLHEVRAHADLTGALARDEQGTFWYVQAPERFQRDCTSAGSAGCRLIRAEPGPFSESERTLTPAMTISAPSDSVPPRTVFGDPFAVSGRLMRTVVRRGEVVRADPIANVTVRLLRRVDASSQPGLGEAFAPTSLTTVTGADGRWSIALTAPPARPWFSAVTEGLAPRTFAGRGTVGGVEALIALSTAGGAFSGTVAPAQPGRTVKIQRLISRNCQTATSGQRFCNERWATVADAPLSGAGTSFAATVANPPPGIYTAALPFADQQADPEAYGGRSAEVTVGG